MIDQVLKEHHAQLDATSATNEVSVGVDAETEVPALRIQAVSSTEIL